MTDDRYVIVYRDGSMGESMCRLDADLTVRLYAGEKNPPAYRIRIREKPLDPWSAYWAARTPAEERAALDRIGKS